MYPVAANGLHADHLASCDASSTQRQLSTDEPPMNLLVNVCSGGLFQDVMHDGYMQVCSTVIIVQ